MNYRAWNPVQQGSQTKHGDKGSGDDLGIILLDKFSNKVSAAVHTNSGHLICKREQIDEKKHISKQIDKTLFFKIR